MKSGIYKITNQVNGHFYVGSTKNLMTREREHRRLLKRGQHHNEPLQRAANKYGINNLLWEVLELCSVDDLLITEQKYLDKCVGKPNCYNIAIDAAAPTRGMLLPQSNETKQKIGDTLRGRPFSKEHKVALSQSAKTRKRRTYSSAMWRKISESQRKHQRPMELELLTMTIDEFRSRYPGVSRSNFYRWKHMAKVWNNLI